VRLQTVPTTVEARFGFAVALQLAETPLRLDIGEGFIATTLTVVQAGSPVAADAVLRGTVHEAVMLEGVVASEVRVEDVPDVIWVEG
jgi:hypothetical protein